MIPILVFGGIIAGLAIYWITKRNRKLGDLLAFLVSAAMFVLALMVLIKPKNIYVPNIGGFGLNLSTEGFHGLYGLICSFMWMISQLFSIEYMHHEPNHARYHGFSLATLSATLGVLYSTDLMTTFLFFEIMSLCSYIMVAQEETKAALRAGDTYLAIAMIGGLTTLMGVFLLYHTTGTLKFDEIASFRAANPATSLTLASSLVLFGFMAKAGMFPLHIWLPKAHPVAPAPASALLSGILTKGGVFGIIVVASYIMRGDIAFGTVFIILAAVTMLLGALLAVFSCNIKRTLACSSVSQIGFICIGISVMILAGDSAEVGSVAAYGAVMHMMNHSLIKLCLFLCAGCIAMNLHKLELEDIRGFGRNKPFLHAIFLIGALALGCIPPFGSGYLSKSLLHESLLGLIGEGILSANITQMLKVIEILFVIGGGLTIAYMLKLYICVFWEKPKQEFSKGKYMSTASKAALVISASALVVLAIAPNSIISRAAGYAVPFFRQEKLGKIAFYSSENLVGALKSILVGAGVYLLLIRPLNKKHFTFHMLDLEDNIYRPVLLKLLPAVFMTIIGFIFAAPQYLLTTVVPMIAVTLDRCIWGAPELAVLGIKKMCFQPPKPKKRSLIGNKVTYRAGKIADGIAAFLNRTIMKNRKIRTDFEFVFDAFWQDLKKGCKKALSSISFGLLLLCIGLVIVCIYLMEH